MFNHTWTCDSNGLRHVLMDISLSKRKWKDRSIKFNPPKQSNSNSFMA